MRVQVLPPRGGPGPISEGATLRGRGWSGQGRDGHRLRRRGPFPGSEEGLQGQGSARGVALWGQHQGQPYARLGAHVHGRVAGEAQPLAGKVRLRDKEGFHSRASSFSMISLSLGKLALVIGLGGR